MVSRLFLFSTQTTMKTLVMKLQENLGKMLRRLPLLALLLYFVQPLSIVADEQTEHWYLVAQLSDETEEFVPMSTVGSLVAADDAYDFTVLDPNGYILLNNVMKVTFKSTVAPSAIRTVRQTENMLARAVNDKLTLIGVSGEVSIYDAAGKLRLSTAATGGETVVSIAHLPSGIYAVKCGKQTFKFNKK